jgi:hypothetical protein
MTNILGRDLIETGNTDGIGNFGNWGRMTSETEACVLK